MKIRLRLLATLKKYLPKDAPRLGEDAVELELSEGTTIAGLIERLGMGRGEWALVMVNGHHQRPDELGRALQEGQSLTITPPIAGG